MRNSGRLLGTFGSVLVSVPTYLPASLGMFRGGAGGFLGIFPLSRDWIVLNLPTDRAKKAPVRSRHQQAQALNIYYRARPRANLLYLRFTFPRFYRYCTIAFSIYHLPTIPISIQFNPIHYSNGSTGPLLA